MHESSKVHKCVTGGFDSRNTPSRDTILTYGFTVPFRRSQIYLKRCVVTILSMEVTQYVGSQGEPVSF